MSFLETIRRPFHTSRSHYLEKICVQLANNEHSRRLARAKQAIAQSPNLLGSKIFNFMYKVELKLKIIHILC